MPIIIYGQSDDNDHVLIDGMFQLVESGKIWVNIIKLFIQIEYLKIIFIFHMQDTVLMIIEN
jgi:hypothetical protein